MCKPANDDVGYVFAEKHQWSTSTDYLESRPYVILGKWETEEKTIIITEREFNDAVRACKVSTYPTVFINLLKKELFK